mgnify:CR=1 FL=1
MEKMTIELLLAKNITLNNTHFWKASDVASLAGYDSIKDIMHAIYGGIEECASTQSRQSYNKVKQIRTNRLLAFWFHGLFGLPNAEF